MPLKTELAKNVKAGTNFRLADPGKTDRIYFMLPEYYTDNSHRVATGHDSKGCAVFYTFSPDDVLIPHQES